ncbi:MAG TPA: hypothetical protein VEJ36_06530 [Nitrososphaerales archaeon]|nr:hypothetical protein [Nitrososphaerales archaeon]
MSRTLLVLSTILVVVGLLVVLYADPVIRPATPRTGPGGLFGGGNSTRSTTFTFPGGFGNFTFSRTFTGIASGSSVAVITNDSKLESYLGFGLIAVGILLEVFSIFLWQTPAPAPAKPVV